MVDPMATGNVKRPSADLHRARGREAFSTHPPTPDDDTTMGSLEQWAEHTWAATTRLPPEAFSDQESSPRHFERRWEPAAAARRWIMSSCTDWKQLLTTSECYDTVRAEYPSRYQRAIVDTWRREANFYELLETWAQRVYTDRQLVCALHLAGLNCGERIRKINQWARKYFSSAPASRPDGTTVTASTLIAPCRPTRTSRAFGRPSTTP